MMHGARVIVVIGKNNENHILLRYKMEGCGIDYCELTEKDFSYNVNFSGTLENNT